jgi:hypothetical protein
MFNRPRPLWAVFKSTVSYVLPIILGTCCWPKHSLLFIVVLFFIVLIPYFLRYDMPPEMDRIGRLESMQVLQMSLNGVRTIPDSLGSGKLQYVLRELHLEFNKIRDLPNTMCNLVKLEKLYLGNNK